MNELLSKSLAQIVNEQHRAASVFEKYNLDYCCKGHRSLRDACSEEHLPLPDVVEEVKDIYAHENHELDFDKIKLYQLADYIVYTHHSYIKRETPRLLSLLEEVSSEYGKSHNELYKICSAFVGLCNETAHHMNREETVLFPRIKQLEQHSFEPVFSDKKYFEYLLLPIIDLEGEHVEVDNIMSEIRRITNDYTPPIEAGDAFRLLYSGLRELESDLHHHIHLENSLLFPKAIALEKELIASMQSC